MSEDIVSSVAKFLGAEKPKFFLEVDNLMIAANTNARNKGFWEDDRPDTDAHSLFHAELSEALEEMRNGDGMSEKIPRFKGTAEELADLLIRMFDTCAQRGYMLSAALYQLLTDEDWLVNKIVDLDEDWSDSFDDIAKVCIDDAGTGVGTHTSFATDIAAGHEIVSGLYRMALDEDNAWLIALEYGALFLYVAAMSGKYDLNVGRAVLAKMKYNLSRPYKHNKQF